MPLVPGSRLGPYEIRAPLGAGGMGEVYRARDPRLGRDVALKIVAASGQRDGDHLRRFQQEAKAVAALNHPHILAIHDVGSENGVSYVVFELLDGQTLRDRLAHDPLPARKAVEYGIQIGRGLAAAHSRGIIHRDLKPENLFLTSDGQIKILDFGLAKLTDVPEGEIEKAATLTATDPGVTLGTAGYMSPEQARGNRADARSDVFALGTILYEMLSGRPAFGGDTRADRTSAVLHHDPPDLTSSMREPVSPGLDRIVRRCLEKDPEERFQTARDVAFALDALGSPSARGSAGEAPRSRMPRALMAATAALALAGSAAAGLFAGRALIERPVTAIKQLTFRRGAVTGARFAPDDRTIVYSASWDGKPNEIFMTGLDGPETRSLGLPPAKLLSVSSRGELAILLTQPGELGDPLLGTLARVALVGGVPRPVLEDVEDADWSPDGGELAIVRKVNGERQLEYPAGNVLWRPIRADPNTHGLRVSPRGDRVALQTDAAITIVDRSGRRQTLALPANTAVGVAWAPEGDAVWVTAGPTDPDKFILRLGLDGSRREIFHAPGVYVLHDVSKSGAALLHHGFERNGVRVKSRGEATEREVPLQALGGGAVDLSADGSQVLIFDLSNWGFYLYPVRGGEPVLLARNLGWAKLSPDGRWLLTGPGASKAAKLMPIGPGEPRDLPLGDPQAYPLSFVDSGRVYWAAQEAGKPARRGFVQDVATGAVRPITPEGVEPLRSPVVDGAVLGRRPDGALLWYPIDGGDPRPTAARLASVSLSMFSPPVSLQTTPDGRWTFVSTGGVPARIDRIDLRNGRREAWKAVAPPDLTGVVWMGAWLPMSPDGEVYAYSYLRVFQDLYLIEGLR